MKHYTSIEQSKKLKELGLPIKTADCSFRPYHYDHCKKEYLYFENYPKWDPPAGIDDIPCWSLGALLELLPSIDDFKPVIDLDNNFIYYEGKLWDETYFHGDTLIDAVFNLIYWLLENNYIVK